MAGLLVHVATWHSDQVGFSSPHFCTAQKLPLQIPSEDTLSGWIEAPLLAHLVVVGLQGCSCTDDTATQIWNRKLSATLPDHRAVWPAFMPDAITPTPCLLPGGCV
jgi:hypothetical protein